MRRLLMKIRRTWLCHFVDEHVPRWSSRYGMICQHCGTDTGSSSTASPKEGSDA